MTDDDDGSEYDSEDYARCEDIESEHSADEEWSPSNDKKRRNIHHKELTWHDDAAHKKNTWPEIPHKKNTWPGKFAAEKKAPDALIGMLNKRAIVKSKSYVSICA